MNGMDGPSATTVLSASVTVYRVAVANYAEQPTCLPALAVQDRDQEAQMNVKVKVVMESELLVPH